MRLKKIHVNCFRLLYDVALQLEERTTVIVGRNNSGKTSLTEVVARFLAEGNSTFNLEDFSCASHHRFWDAYIEKLKGTPSSELKSRLPSITLTLEFEYAVDEQQYGALQDFIIDLDLNCTTANVALTYQIDEENIERLFEGLTDTTDNAIPEFYRTIRERIPKLYATTISAIDPNDETNRRPISKAALRTACMNNRISAQRGLDDDSSKERVVIGKVLENLFATAKADDSDAEGHGVAEDLEQAVKDIQRKIGIDFNEKLNGLLPALSLFGYPGLSDPSLRTETTFDIERLLTNHTKVRYTGSSGVMLPESHNGLGARSIILILLQLREHFKLFCAAEPKPVTHLVFIEEPEVHLHPQMQEVFVRKLGEIAATFSKEISSAWPVQFVISTHSSHLANEAHFECIRYFMSTQQGGTSESKAVVKDLREGLSSKAEPDRSFLYQYMTLTRCDLFFADKAILIEGTTERLMLPRMIRMINSTDPKKPRLGSQYVSIVEVGGAYAHLFFDLLRFLELRTLIITDIDTVAPDSLKKGDKACPVHKGTRSSNTCINSWFRDPANDTYRPTPAELLKAEEKRKIRADLRLAYQVAETDGGPCGRSFEDAFMLANLKHFALTTNTPDEQASEAFEEARDVKKSEFALKYALATDDWAIPRYIREGLDWLAINETPGAKSEAQNA